MRHSFATVLVGANVLFREGLAKILNAERFQVVGCAASLDETLLSLLARHQSILLIIGAGDDPDAACRQIGLFKEKHRAGRVAIVADRSPLSDIIAAFRAGADAYFGEISNYHVFVKALELVMLGEMLLPPEILPFILGHDDGTTAHDVNVDAEAPMEAEHGDDPHLSGQEKRILRCLVEGDANKVIARKMSIAEATVKVHVKAILRKIRVQNRTQAAVWATNSALLVSTTANSSDNPRTTADVAAPLGASDVVADASNSS